MVGSGMYSRVSTGSVAQRVHQVGAVDSRPRSPSSAGSALCSKAMPACTCSVATTSRAATHVAAGVEVAFDLEVACASQGKPRGRGVIGVNRERVVRVAADRPIGRAGPDVGEQQARRPVVAQFAEHPRRHRPGPFVDEQLGGAVGAAELERGFRGVVLGRRGTDVAGRVDEQAAGRRAGEDAERKLVALRDVTDEEVGLVARRRPRCRGSNRHAVVLLEPDGRGVAAVNDAGWRGRVGGAQADVAGGSDAQRVGRAAGIDANRLRPRPVASSRAK